MAAGEQEIRHRVIERLAIEPDDVGLAALVVGMAIATFLARHLRLPAMKSRMRQPVGGDLLMAGEAQPALRLARKRDVALQAILLELGMPGHERPRRDQPLEQALRPHA